MDQYGEFAYIYDRLMEDVDYGQWTTYVEGLMGEGAKEWKILEMACGTGNITIPLTQRGYSVIALDSSEDMLSVAKEKSVKVGLDILFLHQDMRELDLQSEFDCILSMCDGINYIIDKKDLDNTLEGVYGHLKENGLFIFDISSAYKLAEILGHNTFGENLGDLCYLWENYFDEETNVLEMNMTFFIEQENYLYKKVEELHIQRAHRTEALIKAIKKAGFSSVEAFDAFSTDRPSEVSERIFFRCKK